MYPGDIAVADSDGVVIVPQTKLDMIIDKLVEIATRIGKTPQQTAVAWILDHPQVTAAMMGPDTPEQVDDVMSGTGWQLEPTDRQALDAISQIDQPCHIG